jgi:hypothetical protein
MAVKAGWLPAYADARAVERDGQLVWPDSLVMKLGAQAQEIAGVVLDSQGKPIPRAEVWIADATWFGLDQHTPLVLECLIAGEGTAASARADGAGRFRIRGLEARVYKLGALDPATLAAATTEAPAGTENATISVSSADLWDRVAGVIVDKRGNPMAGVQVTLGRNTFEIAMGKTGHYSSGGGRLGPVVTGDDGRFEFKNVAKKDVDVMATAPDILPNGMALASAARPDDVRIVVLLRCHMKVELTNPSDGDQFEVRDGAGRKIGMTTFSGGMSWGTDVGTLTAGSSEVVAVEETARTLVLLSGGKEVRRVALDLKPGQVNVIKP